MTRPDSTQNSSLTRLRQRTLVVRAVRRFFDERDFLEVDTPVCVTAPAPELHIDAVPVSVTTASGLTPRFLQTSPELGMKRLLAAGLPRIYQIAAVFRDGDESPLHTPEFRLLEWYRRDAAWTALCDDCEGLIAATANALGLGTTLRHQGRDIDLRPPFRRVTVDEAFRTHAGFSILEHVGDDAKRANDSLRARLQTLGIASAPSDTWDDLFNRVFLARVEPALVQGPKPVFLCGYPKPLGALARLSQHDSRVSERFELYVAGIEVANGFGELTDPVEQRQRFVVERQMRNQAGKRDYPIDERFLSALDELSRSQTQAAGIALGVERLLMILLDASHIDDVAYIPWKHS